MLTEFLMVSNAKVTINRFVDCLTARFEQTDNYLNTENNEFEHTGKLFIRMKQPTGC